MSHMYIYNIQYMTYMKSIYSLFVDLELSRGQRSVM